MKKRTFLQILAGILYLNMSYMISKIKPSYMIFIYYMYKYSKSFLTLNEQLTFMRHQISQNNTGFIFVLKKKIHEIHNYLHHIKNIILNKFRFVSIRCFCYMMEKHSSSSNTCMATLFIVTNK